MITALDTNVLLDILIPNEAFYSGSLSAIETAAQNGLIVVCDYVYAELSQQFATQKECDRFLAENEIGVQPLTREAHFLAGRAWLDYRKRGGKRARILTDFLVAAHAQCQADRLLTRDQEFYSTFFPSLKAVDPTRHSRPR